MNKLLLTMASAAFLTFSFPTTFTAMAQSDYDRQFLSYPAYNGTDLGVTVNNSGTHFKLWSPQADAVRVNLYDP